MSKNLDKRMPIIGIDILRFIAAISVMFFHFTYLISKEGHSVHTVTHGLASYEPISALSMYGWIGVEIFFVISGFVIALSASHSSPFKFFKSRFLRLVPAAWICATITLLFTIYYDNALSNELILKYVRSISFFPKGGQIDGAYWTLGIEISFYSFVLIFLLMKKWDKFIYFIYGLTIVSATYNLALSLVDNPSDYIKRTHELMLLRHGCEFSLGALLYRIKFFKLTLSSAVFFLLALVASIFESYSQGASLLKTENYDMGEKAIITLLFLTGLSLLVASVMWNEKIVSLLSAKTLQFTRRIGQMTYPLYLIHQIVGSIILYELFKTGMDKYVALGAVLVAIMLFTYAVSLAEPFLATILKRGLDGCKRKWDGFRLSAT